MWRDVEGHVTVSFIKRGHGAQKGLNTFDKRMLVSRNQARPPLLNFLPAGNCP